MRGSSWAPCWRTLNSHPGLLRPYPTHIKGGSHPSGLRLAAAALGRAVSSVGLEAPALRGA